MDAAPTESHGKLAPVSPTDAFQFHLVFSNKTETDGYCLGIWTDLTRRGVQVWQQKKNIPKDSDNWFSEWYPSANVSIKIVCFLTAAYLKSIYCMKEFRVAAAMDKLLVVVCEPMQAIRAVDPGQYPHASDALAYLLGGGQVIFHDSDDVVSEIMKFIPKAAEAAQPEPELEVAPAPLPGTDVSAAEAWPAELAELVAIPSFATCLSSLEVNSLADFAECVDVDEGHDKQLKAVLDALPSKPRKNKLLRQRALNRLSDLLQRLALFIEFDSEGEGSLSRVDCLRIPAEQMRAREGGTIGDRFDEIDTDRDGRVSFEELFLAAEMPAGEGVPPAQEAQRALQAQRAQVEEQAAAQRAAMEEQAAALRLQQSALDKQVAAVEAEKRLVADAKQKAEQEARRAKEVAAAGPSHPSGAAIVVTGAGESRCNGYWRFDGKSDGADQFCKIDDEKMVMRRYGGRCWGMHAEGDRNWYLLFLSVPRLPQDIPAFEPSSRDAPAPTVRWVDRPCLVADAKQKAEQEARRAKEVAAAGPSHPSGAAIVVTGAGESRCNGYWRFDGKSDGADQFCKIDDEKMVMRRYGGLCWGMHAEGDRNWYLLFLSVPRLPQDIPAFEPSSRDAPAPTVRWVDRPC